MGGVQMIKGAGFRDEIGNGSEVDKCLEGSQSWNGLGDQAKLGYPLAAFCSTGK